MWLQLHIPRDSPRLIVGAPLLCCTRVICTCPIGFHSRNQRDRAATPRQHETASAQESNSSEQESNSSEQAISAWVLSYK
jgi:hypothetical protein